MKHVMMMSDLYGRIGQTLREHGDAPIGYVKRPLFSDGVHFPMDYIQPVYCEVAPVTTEIDGIKIKTYEIEFD